MKCGQCGTEVPNEASFCHSCGSQVSDADGQASVSGEMGEDSLKNTEMLLRKETQGEFEIEGLLGRGGMAMVYLATEVHLSRKVAIKVLPPELTFGHGVERFKREAKTAAGLDHPYIIPIYRIASGGTLFWYAMKFLEGQSLDELLREKGQTTLEETIEILMPVAEALDYGHLHSVIHRDIKPANIMLDLQNRVIVTDFGIAKALTDSKLTASGSVIGTPFYMSPEQGMGKPVTGAADQYSCGVMAYRMLSGQIPFEGDSAIEILHKHCSATPPPLKELRPGLPDHVYQAIDKALSKKPAQRFSNVKAFVKALKEPSQEITVSTDETMMVQSDPSIADRISTEVIDRAPTPVPTPPPEPTRPVEQPAEKKGRVWKVLVPLLAIVSVGIGGGAWWMMQRSSNNSPSPVLAASDQPADSTSAIAAEGATNVTAQEEIPSENQAETTAPEPDPPSTPAPANTGTISVTNMMPSGLVLVDGTVQSGQVFEVSPGEHRIEMRQPGYDSASETVTIRAGQTIEISFGGEPIQTQQTTPRPTQQRPTTPQYGVISILLRPSPGGNVFIDGRLTAATTTRFVNTLSAGNHNVRIERDGYVTVDTTIRIAASDTTQLRLRLRKP